MTPEKLRELKGEHAPVKLTVFAGGKELAKFLPLVCIPPHQQRCARQDSVPGRGGEPLGYVMLDLRKAESAQAVGDKWHTLLHSRHARCVSVARALHPQSRIAGFRDEERIFLGFQNFPFSFLDSPAFLLLSWFFFLK